MPKKLIQERLKELLHYDSEIGIFTWAKSGAKKGNIAGNINRRGYRRIWIDDKQYKASRLAWLYMEGYWPEHEVDHRNRIKHDDRWENLRHVSRQCNIRNRYIQNNNKSGITGVCWKKRDKKWMAHITISGKNIYLGYFNSRFDAAKARWNAEVKYGFPDCNIISSAYSYLMQIKSEI